jgi:hypothetical protein
MLRSSVFGSRRVRSCTATLCLAWVLALACLPAVAFGASVGLGANQLQQEATEGSPETETTTTATTATSTATTESSTKNSGPTVLIVVAIAAALLATVAFVIVRDARRVAPAGDGGGELGEGSTPRHSEAALRKRRAKAKAARAQRKRNR